MLIISLELYEYPAHREHVLNNGKLVVKLVSKILAVITLMKYIKIKQSFLNELLAFIIIIISKAKFSSEVKLKLWVPNRPWSSYSI